MSKFESLFTSLLEDTTTGTPVTPGTTPTTPATNTPAVFDQQHPVVQALAGASTPQAVLDALKKNNLTLAPAPAGTSTPVHNDTQTTPAPNAA